MRGTAFLAASVASVVAATFFFGCSHPCKSNADCPAGDSCRPTSSNNISSDMACGPCVVVGLECVTNADCCSGSCPQRTDNQVCRAPDAGIEHLDSGAEASD